MPCVFPGLRAAAAPNQRIERGERFVDPYLRVPEDIDSSNVGGTHVFRVPRAGLMETEGGLRAASDARSAWGVRNVRRRPPAPVWFAMAWCVPASGAAMPTDDYCPRCVGRIRQHARLGGQPRAHRPRSPGRPPNIGGRRGLHPHGLARVRHAARGSLGRLHQRASRPNHRLATADHKYGLPWGWVLGTGSGFRGGSGSLEERV